MPHHYFNINIIIYNLDNENGIQISKYINVNTNPKIIVNCCKVKCWLITDNIIEKINVAYKYQIHDVKSLNNT